MYLRPLFLFVLDGVFEIKILRIIPGIMIGAIHPAANHDYKMSREIFTTLLFNERVPSKGK